MAWTLLSATGAWKIFASCRRTLRGTELVSQPDRARTHSHNVARRCALRMMPDATKAKPTAEPFVPEEHTLPVLRAAMPGCKGCDLYKHATHVVPGMGAARAKLVLVGEQPGDKEDLEGAPFVGPAGAVLRRAMDELGIDGKH